MTRLGLAAGLGLLLGACSFGYVTEFYGTNTVPGQVTVGCRATYQVYDKPEAKMILVLDNVLAEAWSLCDEYSHLTRNERLRLAVDRYLENVGRPQCKARGEPVELTPQHVEFRYRCAPVTPRI